MDCSESSINSSKLPIIPEYSLYNVITNQTLNKFLIRTKQSYGKRKQASERNQKHQILLMVSLVASSGIFLLVIVAILSLATSTRIVFAILSRYNSDSKLEEPKEMAKQAGAELCQAQAQLG